MRMLKVEKRSVSIELPYDEIGILHYALYDYLAKIEAKIKCNNQNKRIGIKLNNLKDKILSMTETVNGVI